MFYAGVKKISYISRVLIVKKTVIWCSIEVIYLTVKACKMFEEF